MEKVTLKVLFPIRDTVLEFPVDWEANLKGLIQDCAKASNLENGGLYMLSKDGEHLLQEDILVSSLLQVLNDSILLIYKRKPSLVKVIFVQHLYVDSDTSIGAVTEEAKRLITTKKDYCVYTKSEPLRSPECNRLKMKNFKETNNLQGFEGVETFNDFKKIPLKNTLGVANVNDENPFLVVECNSEEKPPSFSQNNAKKSKSLKLKSRRMSLSHSSSKKLLSSHFFDSPHANNNNNVNPAEPVVEGKEQELRESIGDKEGMKNKLKTLRRQTSSAIGFVRKSSSTWNINEMNSITTSPTSPASNSNPALPIAQPPTKLFGSSLSSAQMSNGCVPDVIINLVKHLEDIGAVNTEGIFRICATQQKLDQCISYIEEKGGVDMDLSGYDIHTVANTLKSYLRLLPNPVIEHDLYPRFMAAVCLEDETLRNAYFNTIINTLPEIHRQTLRVLLGFLRKIADNEKVNKMSERNLSIVFGPLLLRKEGDDVKSFLQYSNYIIKSATNLIESFSKLFVDGPPIRTITSTFDHTAEKLGELDLKRNSVIHIFMRDGDDWLGETNGRFATFSQKYIDKTLSWTPDEPDDLSDSVRNKKALKRKQSKSNLLNEEEFLKLFQCTSEIFVLLPKWKQDSLLKSAGLLEGNVKIDEKRKYQARTIPVGSNMMKSMELSGLSSDSTDSLE